ncbi:MAG: preprotein translocase subunit YajC [Rhodospirillales bacterium]|nr:preprotein translocase subunit YajC [Rhodospirillales bacterium]MCB9965822.1 preprotein translocase subunit YajC [Rhodospirillales bacterium]
MWISTAYATEAIQSAADVAPPSMGQAFLYNAGFIIMVVVMFYIIFIRPQQKRMNDHMDMLNALKVGDAVVTGGGLVGKISKLIDEKEIEVELAKDIKVVALRSTLLERPAPQKKAANDDKTAKADKKKA